MEIQTNSKVDVTINKDDLIEIMIDDQLTKLEEQVKVKRAKILALNQETTAINEKLKLNLNKKFMKLLPVTTQEKPTLEYSLGYQDTRLTFRFTGWEIRMGTLVNTNVKYPPRTVEITKEIGAINTEIFELDGNIKLINNSGKRVKAKMVRGFLEQNEEGKAILALLGKQKEGIALLGNGK